MIAVCLIISLAEKIPYLEDCSCYSDRNQRCFQPYVAYPEEEGKKDHCPHDGHRPYAGLLLCPWSNVGRCDPAVDNPAVEFRGALDVEACREEHERGCGQHGDENPDDTQCQ